MNSNFQSIIGASIVSLLALPALAQSPIYSQERIRHTRTQDHLNGAVKASDVIGMLVRSSGGGKIGAVEDLALDMESGRIVEVIVSTGGYTGLGDMLTAVPPGALHFNAAEKELRLDADREKVKSAPKFELSDWDKSFDSDHLSASYDLFGEEPAFRFIHKGDSVLGGQRNTVTTYQPDGSYDYNRVLSQTQSEIPEARLGHIQRASALMDTSVNNPKDENLGKVENILLDLESGRIVAVVVSSGGYLGKEDELSALPPTALRYNVDRHTLQLNASKEMLSNGPHFRANQWPDFAEPGYANGVYRAYLVEPYFIAHAATPPDNTANNVRDRASSTLTAFDQGSSTTDVATTAQIRKGIIGTKDLSVNAKNVKIITIDGRVTLRGPVNSPLEKHVIGEIAGSVAQAGNVNNELEVK
jgi:sporulation protein YlmC with PRC-barrel domain